MKSLKKSLWIVALSGMVFTQLQSNQTELDVQKIETTEENSEEQESFLSRHRTLILTALPVVVGVSGYYAYKAWGSQLYAKLLSKKSEAPAPVLTVMDSGSNEIINDVTSKFKKALKVLQAKAKELKDKTVKTSKELIDKTKEKFSKINGVENKTQK